MNNKQIFNIMVEMEIASAKNPNAMQTYEYMWNTLKKQMQFGLYIDEKQNRKELEE